ncbi:MAG: acyl-CoA/acyl-ACP dehydrogenase [Gammaproteobacteria bacterium]|nr:acyl-CoA/acyl-ACP dehydrogenase [Gammaproteobacteria bacterium]
MNFELPPSAQLLRDSARDMLAARCALSDIRNTLPAQTTGEADEFGSQLWSAFANLGWTGLLLPDSYGGSGASVLDAVILCEELGRACCPMPLVESAIVAPTLIRQLDPSLTDLLSAVVSGQSTVALALVDDRDYHNPLVASLALDKPEIRGVKLLVNRPPNCDKLLVFGRFEGKPACALIAANEPTIRWRPHPTLSVYRFYDVEFDRTPVSAAKLLGDVTQSGPSIESSFALGMLGHCAHMLGAADYTLELCVDYAKVREQSGQPIGAHQAIQHRLADMAYGIDGSRQALYRAAHEQGNLPAPTMHAVHVAKAFASRTCLDVVRGAHQIFGAIGFCEEHFLHLYHKHVQASSVSFGDEAFHLDEVANAIGLVSG